MQPEGKKYEINTAEIVSGVMDLFPCADRQALTCLAELLEKRIAELTAERDKARRYCSVAAYDMAGFAKTLKARPEAFPRTTHDLMETSEFMRLAGEGRENGTVYDDELSKEKARVAELKAVLEWYGEQAAGCPKITQEGDLCRHALDRDGGARARAVLAHVECTGATASERHALEGI